MIAKVIITLVLMQNGTEVSVQNWLSSNAEVTNANFFDCNRKGRRLRVTTGLEYKCLIRENKQ